MKNNKKLALAAATFGIAALAMGGSTFAWFTVVNTANVALQGTIVGVDDRLEVGFRTTNAIADPASLGLLPDTTGLAGVGEYVYWAPNSVTPTVMAAVIAADGHNSSNELSPITTGSYVAGVNEALGTFYSRPEFSANRTNAILPLVADASADDYIGFSIIFRALDEEDNAVAGLKILFDEGTAFNASDSATNALRVGITGDGYTDIIHPTAPAAGTIEVGGVMDLNGDGVNDYTLQEYVSGDPLPVYEIAYGEFEETLVVPTHWKVGTGAAVAEQYSNELFYAGETGVGVHGLDITTLVPDYVGTVTPLTAAYNTIAAYKSAVTPLGTTDSSGLVELDFMVWLEGWDHACVNSISNATLGATFAFIAVE